MDKSFSLGLFLTLILLLVVTALQATPLQRRVTDEDGPLGGGGRPGSKRTFCNAFTGCGRKRSEASLPLPAPLRERERDREQQQQQQQQQREQRDYSDYSERDRNSEDNSEDGGAMEDVARDILAEARLWEALQARNSLRPSGIRSKGGFRSGGGSGGNGSRRPLEEQLPN